LSKGVLVDISKCMGCKGCQVACKQWNDLPATKTSFNNDLGSPADASGNTWTHVRFRTVENGDEVKYRFAKRQCFHCEEPACASACFAKALQKTPEGPVVYHPNLCVGCRYCMLACPFEVPKYEWNKTFPLIAKCQFCFDPDGKYDRLGNGLKPACVSTCPTGCLQYGDREELVAQAWARINSDSKYVKHVFGEKEVGGTSWLYISDVPFETFGFRTDVTTRPLPEYTESFMKLTPIVALSWGTLLTGMFVYTKRRNEISKEKDDQNVGL